LLWLRINPKPFALCGLVYAKKLKIKHLQKKFTFLEILLIVIFLKNCYNPMNLKTFKKVPKKNFIFCKDRKNIFCVFFNQF
jgi:hypothetical protein